MNILAIAPCPFDQIEVNLVAMVMLRAVACCCWCKTMTPDSKFEKWSQICKMFATDDFRDGPSMGGVTILKPPNGFSSMAAGGAEAPLRPGCHSWPFVTQVRWLLADLGRFHTWPSARRRPGGFLCGLGPNGPVAVQPSLRPQRWHNLPEVMEEVCRRTALPGFMSWALLLTISCSEQPP